MTPWTTEQKQAIQTIGKSLIVSAAAGSGKTAVLAERCAYLVCDAPEKCDIDRLLVVTFTKAAAAEMQGRIELAMRRRLDAKFDDRLSRQLLLLNRASISTIHGFCTAFLRRHFDRLGMDPNFRVLDEQEVQLLRHDIVRELLDDRYETDAGGAFQRFVDLYGDGNDQPILRKILHLHDLMTSIVDPDSWLNQARKQIAGARTATRLVDSTFGRALLQTFQDWLEGLARRWIQLAEQISQTHGLERYAEIVTDLLAATQYWQQVLGDGNFDLLAAEVRNLQTERLPTIRNAPPEKEIIQARLTAIRDEMKGGPVAGLCRFTESDWRAGLAEIQPHVDVLVELIQEFRRRFDQAKQELRGLDFADLERFTLQILRDDSDKQQLRPSEIARSYHGQFEHVLVDEFQDVNEVQDAILFLLSRESSSPPSESTNLFTVGDVKQSIYRFRLAQPEQFLKRSARLGQLQNQKIDLSKNFRSRQPLLEVINSIFERLMTEQAMEIEYDQSHRLVAGAQFPPENGKPCFKGAPVELHLLPKIAGSSNDHSDDGSEADDLDRTEREAAFVAHRIRQLLESGTCVSDRQTDGTAALRPIQPRDIVVLLRSTKFKSEEFANAMRSQSIAVHNDSSTGFFDSMEIRDLLALLRVLDNQQQDIPLAAVLRSPLANLPEPEDCLARIRLAYPDDRTTPFHQAVTRYANEKDDELAAHLRQFLSEVSEWRRLARQRPLAELIWHVYDSTGYLAFCAGMNDGEQRVANLIDFHERARQFGTFQRQGLSRFMDFLHNLAEHSDLGTASIASQADNVVRIMSVHRSKGLEFPVVILPDLGKLHNFSDTHGSILADREAGIGLLVADETRRVRYPSLAHALVQQRIRKQSLAEEMRVLYVAMTRAKEHLILIGTCEPTAMQGWRDDWSKHVGPLPAERLLGARSMLDWIGPAAAGIEAQTPGHFDLILHDESEIAAWHGMRSSKHVLFNEIQQRLARLEPLDPVPSMYQEAQHVQEAIEFQYPHRKLVSIRADVSVGAMTKLDAPFATSATTSNSFKPELATPRCMLAELKPSAAEAGSATHLFLEHLDFSRPCHVDDLKLQLADLVRRRIMTHELANLVKLDSILWLLGTSLGATIRKNAPGLKRELSIYYPIPAPNSDATDPMDRVMVRGRVDLLVPDQPGWIIVDYKTDQVTEETIHARVEFYRAQLSAYRQAIARITGTNVAGAMLVFLTAKQIHEIQ